MTLFRPPSPPPPKPPEQWRASSPAQKGDRSLVYRDEFAGIPSHRRDARGRPLNTKGGKAGLTNSIVLDRPPRGCLFEVRGTNGFFDLDGYWCVRKSGHRVEVRRGSPKRILRLLSPVQRKELDRVRLAARRAGLR